MIVATVSALLLIAQQVAGKIARDSLFLSEHAGEDLAYAMLASAAGSIALAVWASRWMSRHAPSRVLITGLLTSAAAFVAESFFAHRAPDVVAWVVFIHVGAIGPVTISGFWAAVNERFDAGQASRVFVWIASGATLGGVIGGIAAERIASALSLPALLLVLGVAGCLSAVATWLLHRGAAQVTTPADPSENAAALQATFGRIAREPALLRLGAVIALSAAVATLLDFAMKSQAALALPDRASLVAFFSMFHTLTGVLAFAVSSAVSQRLLTRLGVAKTLSLYPLSVLGAGGLAAVSYQLSALVLARSVETVIANSLFRSAYEILFSPLPASLRRATKTILDVVCFRIGDLLGSGAVLLAVAFARDLVIPVALASAMAAAVLILGFVRALGRDYGAGLRRRLETGLAAASRLDAANYLGADREAADLVAECREHGVRLSRPLVETALRAARADDPELRDTALAYLRNALPEDIRDPWFAKHERRMRRVAHGRSEADMPQRRPLRSAPPQHSGPLFAKS